MAEKDSTGGFASGFTLGVLVGLTIAFLYTPRSGRENKQLLEEKLESVREKAVAAIDNVRQSAGSRLLKIPDYSSTNFVD
jgi:gas vesicle protein